MRHSNLNHAVVSLVIAVVVFEWVQILLAIHWEKALPSNRVENEMKWKRPTVFYHPGPPKMGTTSIQCALSQYQLHLRQDGYLFAGKIPIKFCPPSVTLSQELQNLACLFNLPCQKELQNGHQSGRTRSQQSWTKLQRTIGRLHQKGINIVLSDETHSMFHDQDSFDIMPNLFFSHLFFNWTKHLVVGYRWYWQFWLSSRHEYNRLFTSGGGRLQMQDWGGRQLQSIGDMLLREIATDSYLTPHTHSTLRMYQRYFDKVSILNVHDTGDLVQRFICEILQAKSTCKQYHPAPKYNPSNGAMDAADMDRVVMASTRWINTTKHTRWQVVNKTLNLNDAPRTKMSCPSVSALQRLLHKSLDDEDCLFPNRSGVEHVQQFWATSFCSVDVAATLNGDDWRQFFQHYFS